MPDPELGKCPAILKSGKLCGNPSIHGVYCGIQKHRNSNPIKVSLVIKEQPLKPKKIRGKLKAKAPDPSHKKSVEQVKLKPKPIDNTYNKVFTAHNIQDGKNEYLLWCEVRRRLCDEGALYFSFPIDTVETAESYVIVFDNDGLELCDDVIIKQLTTKSLTNIVYKVMYGLYLLNSNGICHLDVKPENILINPDTLEPKIIDIGNGHMINDNIFVKPSIDLDTNTIYPSEYMFYPPMKFFMEKWITDLSIDNITTATDLLADYMRNHVKTLYDLFPIASRLDMINLYDGSNPRSILYRILNNKTMHKISCKYELSKWDAYGTGITILVMLNSHESLYDSVLFNIGFQMTHPDARKRLGLLEALDYLEKK
jgi:serine/threonine protein kinase